MVDALSCNTSFMDKDFKEEFDVIVTKCLTHGRRQFYNLRDFFPEECKYFLDKISLIYLNEEKCKDRGYDAATRLVYHQDNSKEHMDDIYSRIDKLLANKQVEPNSNLGKAMKYWLNHKEGLCQFLEIEGADLDNNPSERALKDIILQRKNSLFHKTLNGAKVLSGLSSIVKTCFLNKVNAYGYLNWIQDNFVKVTRNPENFMPWHYSGLSPPVLA